MSDTIQVIGGEIDIDEARRTVRKFDLPLGSADMLELNTRDMRSSGLTPTLVKNSNEATLEALNLLVAAFTGFRDNLAQAMVALHPYVVPEMHCRDIENATKWNHIVEHISKMKMLEGTLRMFKELSSVEQWRRLNVALAKRGDAAQATNGEKTAVVSFIDTPEVAADIILARRAIDTALGAGGIRAAIYLGVYTATRQIETCEPVTAGIDSWPS